MIAKDYARQAHGSFALPDACFKVKQLMEDKTSDAEDFANVISLDPSMASRLLQIANSAIYNFRYEVTTISRAVTLVGTRSIYNMMLIDVATTAFKHFATPAINLKQFWVSSILTGLICKNLAFKAGIRDIERMFVVGLLHDFGKLIVAKISPGLAKQIDAEPAPKLPWQIQHELLGFNYSQVTAELLSLWQLPEKIILPIRYYTQANKIETNNELKVLLLAVLLTLAYTNPEYFSYESEECAEFCKALNISQADIEEALKVAKQEVKSVVASMRIKLY